MSSLSPAGPPDASRPPLPGQGVPLLLTRLSLAIARRRAYASAHPMVAAADHALTSALQERLAGDPTLSLAVAKRDLLVNGERVAPPNAVAEQIANRLHRAGIGAVRFHHGVTREAVTEFLRLLARRPADPTIDQPLPELTGIAMGRLTYAELGLADERSLRTETAQLWQTLAQRLLAAVSPDGGADGGADGDDDSAPTRLGAALSHATRSEAAARQAFDALDGLADRVTLAPHPVRETIGERLQALLSATDQGAIVATLRSASRGARARLVSNVVEVLPAAAVVRWLHAASQASGHDLSPHLLRVLSKMSVHFRGRRPDTEVDALRETAKALVNGWELSEPNPEEHATLLDTLAAWTARDGAGSAPAGGQLFDAASQEAVRLLHMAVELDTVSVDAAHAVRRLADLGHTSVVLSWIARAPSERTRTALRDLTLTPAALLRVLLAEPLDAAEARHLLDNTSTESAGVLIDALEQCESRAGRRLIFDRLRAMPSAIAGTVRERLTHAMPWYLARNLLALLRELIVADPSLATTLVPGTLLLFQKHEHVAVRREAIRLLAQFPTMRIPALRRALHDAANDVRQAAIDVAYAARQQEHPVDLALRLLALADDDSLDTGSRDKAVRAVGHSLYPEVRAWLTDHASRKTRLLGSVKLAPLTDTVRAAVQVLAARAGDDPGVQPLVALGRKAGIVDGAA
ncbi:hypothetical protein [Gemmatimonas sp.]|uniref:hypothetical protein n=1 Tax=Gemmatimonas sp. TaxID=1962908 RepID=UPI0037BE7B3C